MSEMFSEPEAVPVDPLQSIRDRAAKRKESGVAGGVREWFDIDYLLRVIDGVEYEYNVERKSLESNTVPHIWYDKWMSKDEAEAAVNDYIEAEDIHEAEEGFRYATYRLIKRRKAGEVEDA